MRSWMMRWARLAPCPRRSDMLIRHIAFAFDCTRTAPTAASAATTSPNVQGPRSRIVKMSAEVVDDNPYSRLMALQRMGIVKDYERIRQKTVQMLACNDKRQSCTHDHLADLGILLPDSPLYASSPG